MSMTAQQARDALRGIIGLKDTFLGFSQVVDALKPVVDGLEDMEKTLTALGREKNSLLSDIDSMKSERARIITDIAKFETRLSELRQIFTQAGVKS